MAALGSHLFGTLIRVRERAYACGRLGSARLLAPVISVGNLRVGGSGKTPAVIAIGRELLRRRGPAFDVLTRGYRRASHQLEIAIRGDEDASAVGDEPRLIAQKLHVPVLVHPDRFRSGMEGERRFQSQLHLLDDGFQHWQLTRDFDIVLVTESDLDDRLLPAGRLRETPAALARAGAVIWVSHESERDAKQTLAEARTRLRPWTAAPVYAACKRARPLTALPRRAYAFCGLARPESFWATLAEMGIPVAGRSVFRDHHRYRDADLRRLRAEAAAAGADVFLTTEKDAMNLPAGWPDALHPLQAVEIDLHIDGLAELVDRALEALPEAARTRFAAGIPRKEVRRA